jgi:hypothetical protein
VQPAIVATTIAEEERKAGIEESEYEQDVHHACDLVWVGVFGQQWKRQVFMLT